MQKGNIALILTILATCTLFFNAGFAQSTAADRDSSAAVDTMVYELGEVVVTGTRYKKKIIDIPYSIQRISNSEFQFARKAGVNDVMNWITIRSVPSRAA